jgi:hypothetical protein
MSVYVDDMQAPYRGMKMCHMAADSTEELLAMADKVGVQRKWIQYPGTAKEHFDICLSKRAIAVQNGAQELTMLQFGRRYIELAKKRIAAQQANGSTHEGGGV